MNVLSLFDGLSGCRIALDRIGVVPSKYYASEIDKYAIKVAQANYPDTIQLGNITDWQLWNIDWSTINLVTGGFPCQAWSVAGKQQGDKDERGMLFWVMLDVMKHVLTHNPKAKFLIENVKMKKEFEQYITHHTEQALGKVEKILINSALVSAQNRNRYYWHNLGKIEQPDDKKLILADIIENGVVDREKSYCIDANYHKGGNTKTYFERGKRQLVFVRPYKLNDCSHDLLCQHIADTDDRKGDENIKKVYDTSGEHNEPKIAVLDMHRKLTPLECERLQTLPDNYTNYVSNTQRYKMIGNGWTIDVIVHIFKNLFCEEAVSSDKV